jgi:tRNA (guanine-N7-)-methyltransferase
MKNIPSPSKMLENRSYVIRAVRMSPHQKSALARLSPQYCLDIQGDISDIRDGGASSAIDRVETIGAEKPSGTLLAWNHVFTHRINEPERPIYIDIGFGMGNELAELAEKWSHADFLGIEVHLPGIGKLLSEIERRNLRNIRIVRQDAVLVCTASVPKKSIDGLHLFFPDPWPKKRHHKRRLVREGFPELIAPIIKTSGYVYMVTDWQEYAEQMLEVMESSPLFINRFNRFAIHQEWRPQTAFERKGLKKGHSIYELIFETR